MHCSANVGRAAIPPLFRPLRHRQDHASGRPLPRLIGDDEHGWSETALNSRDGCYPGHSRLRPKPSRRSTPARAALHHSGKRGGHPLSRRLDLNDGPAHENTRGAYPLDYIENYLPPRWPAIRATWSSSPAMPSGVMPPISRLTPDQAIYHFISGYTSKIAGTEIGLARSPKSRLALFWRPLHGAPSICYAEMLKARLLKYGATFAGLVNTAGTRRIVRPRQRISIKQHPRAF